MVTFFYFAEQYVGSFFKFWIQRFINNLNKVKNNSLAVHITEMCEGWSVLTFNTSEYDC